MLFALQKLILMISPVRTIAINFYIYSSIVTFITSKVLILIEVIPKLKKKSFDGARSSQKICLFGRTVLNIVMRLGETDAMLII